MDLIEALKAKQGTMARGEFARRLGISAATLSRIYSGDRLIGEDVARRIARAFPDLMWLATGYVMTKDGDAA